MREQDASFDRRFEGFKEYLEPFDHNVFAQMIKHKSGYDNEDEIMLMIKVMNDMNRNANETGDWQTSLPTLLSYAGRSTESIRIYTRQQKLPYCLQRQRTLMSRMRYVRISSAITGKMVKNYGSS